MTPEKKTVRTNRGLKEYTYLGCPLTRNRSAWCFRLCAPDPEGHGNCGRVAPHGLRGNIRDSMEQYNEKQLEIHFEKLEHLYLAAPCGEYYDPGVRISQGEAEIVIAIEEKFSHAAGTVHGSVCFTALNDSALLAVQSHVDDALVVTSEFTIHVARPTASGQLFGRGRFLGASGDHYLAESVLIDSEGEEIGRGGGTFAKSPQALSAEMGYR